MLLLFRRKLEQLYAALDRPLAQSLLDHLQVSYTAEGQDRIPRAGACIVVANHPYGLLDGAILAALLANVRPDVRILANHVLHELPELRDLIIPVDPVTGRGAINTNRTGLRQSLAHLRGGGLLLIFPAGEVAHSTWRSLRPVDREWNTLPVRLAALTGNTAIVPCHVSGSNSGLFQLAGLMHSRVRTALLGRELLYKRGHKVTVRIGTPIPCAKLLAMPTVRQQTDYLRWRSDLLAEPHEFKAHTSRPLARRENASYVPVAGPISAEKLDSEIAGLAPKRLMLRSGDLAVYLAPAAEIPIALHEIGRLREVTFRAVGEGTGKPLDLDVFDTTYLHLFVWHEVRREIVGAYRLGRTDQIRQRQGLAGLYTATLFEYSEAFLDATGPALELGRSFVRQEYQRAFAPLLLLWKGIGRYIAQHPEYKVLYGPVSISNRYQSRSRDLMVRFLEKYAWLEELRGQVRHRNAWKDAGEALPASPLDLDDLGDAIADIEPDHAGVPVLLRQYLRLGGKLLGFNLDPDFSNALDGLILVDLTRTEPGLLDRYLGRREANIFLKYQAGIRRAA